MTQTDLDILDQIKENDQKALESLFKLHYESLCNFAHVILRDHDLAEEAVADVFFTFWEKAKTLTIHKSIKSYLFASVKYKSLQLLKKSHISFEQIEAENDHHSLESPEETYLFEELKSEYQRAYESLPKQCQLVFKLHKIDGFKYGEISELLDIAQKTVENHMTKALQLIRQHIRKYQLEKS